VVEVVDTPGWEDRVDTQGPLMQGVDMPMTFHLLGQHQVDFTD
jgi:hypothetical protein